MNKNILNNIIIEWNNSNIEDSGFLKVSDISNRMKYQLVYTRNKPGRIKIFDRDFTYFNEFKNKVYINNKHIELDGKGLTVNEYEPGEYYVYIDRFDGWKTIGSYAFYSCSDLTSVTIPNSVIWIAGWPFYHCIGLTEVTIPDSVTVISRSAFQDCTGLTSITIPNSVASIGYQAFYHCNNLKTVYVEDIDKFNEIEFEDEYSNPTCYGAKLIELKK